MLDRSRKKRHRATHPSTTRITQVATKVEEYLAESKEEKNPAAVALGRLGGKKGGPARAASLSAAERKRIAQKAAKARWAKYETPSK